MERFVKGEAVVLEFPYSDLSSVKRRPSLILAELKGENLILCQITGQIRPDPDLVYLFRGDFEDRGLQKDSFILPSFIFTLHKSKIKYSVGKINPIKIKEVEEKLIKIFTI